VVEAPAKRYGVTVDSELVDALVENAPLVSERAV
jgi:hypothetical protein